MSRRERRYDIAKAVMAGLAAGDAEYDGNEAASLAVNWADCLIDELSLYDAAGNDVYDPAPEVV